MHPLLAAVVHETPHAVDALRTALTAAGGPLRTPNDDGTIRLTFVWIADDETDVVSVQCGLVRHGRSTALERVGATSVFALDADAPDDALVSYRFVVDDPFLRGEPADDEAWQKVMLDAQERSFADPFNPQRIAPLAVLFGLPVTDEQYESVLSLRDGPAAPWFAPHDAPAGVSTTFDHTSGALGDTRTVTVWSPPGAGTGLPLAVLLDGESFVHIARLPRALDLAVQRGDIPPVVVAMVSGPHGSRGLADRTRELSCNAQHATMLAVELIPVLRDRYPVDPSPAATILGGASLGGLQSAFTAMEHPQVVGNVLSVSGSFWYGPDLPDHPEWLTARIAAEQIRPLRMYQQIGRLEDGPLPFAPGVTHLGANRRFRDTALARGYDLHYDELTTAHDICAFRVAVVRGLQHLVRG